MLTPDSAFALVRTSDQWLRCAHQETALDAESGVIELAVDPDAGKRGKEGARTAPAGVAPIAGGLVFDAACQVYRSLPDAGRVESTSWSPGLPAAAPVSSVDLLERGERKRGDFSALVEPSGPLASPRALWIDAEQRLFVAEAGKNRVLVYDLYDRRLARVLRFASESALGPRPIDLGPAPGGRVYVLTEQPTRLFLIDARQVLEERALPPGVGTPSRLAVSAAGRLALLDPALSRVLLVDSGRELTELPRASDLEFEDENTLLIALSPGEDFERRAIDGPEPVRARLRARGYDGRGIATAPGGGVAFWSERGPRLALAERRRYQTSGRVTTFRLDSGTWQSTWGRLLVDACLPEGSQLRASCVAVDEPPEEALVTHTLPTNAKRVALPFPELTPPLPPLSFVAREGDFQPLHRRADGSELPWSRVSPEDRFVTLEAPVQAGPEAGATAPLLRGRYLWVTLQLRGDGRVTPRVRCLRAEHHAHDYLRRIPRAYSVDASMESFLHRYLGMFGSLLGDLDARGAARHALLDAVAAPDEALGWLASFLGLVLDERWATAPRPGGQTVDARRQLIAEAASLFRLRGTVLGLSRFIELYIGAPPIVFEQYRARGLGGAWLGESSTGASNAVVGAGLRVGGTLGSVPGAPVLTGAQSGAEDAFRSHAHRFSVLLPNALTDEQLEVVTHILELHRPAHTRFELCTRGPGMRLGLGLHLGLSSLVGDGGRFETARLGEALLGRGAIVGRPGAGTALGSARLDGGMRLA